MFLVKPVLIFIWLVLMPFLSGYMALRLFGVKLEKQNNKLVLSYVQGWLIIMSVFQLLAIPMTFLRIKFNVLVICWVVIIIFFGISSLFVIKATRTELKWNNRIIAKEIPWNMILAIVLILVQTLVVVIFQHTDDDDAFYVGTAVTTLHNNSMYMVDPYTGNPYGAFPARYVLSPFPVFIALLGKLTMLHPTIIAHTILPFFLIPLAYLVYYLIGYELFRGNKSKLGTFLCMVSVLNIWGNFSVYTTSSFLLFRIWQGKAVLGNILLLLGVFLIMRIAKSGLKGYYVLLTLTLVLSGAMVSSMGIFLIPMLLGIYAIINVILRKNLATFFRILLCCIPAFVFGLMYVFAL